MTAVVITQPMLFPWPGFFEQLQLADVYIYLDDAQFSKGSFTNRVQLQQGDERRWLTIPLQGKGAFQRIYDLQATPGDWRGDHLAVLASVLARAPRRDQILDLCREVYAEAVVCDLLIASIERTASLLGVGEHRQLLRSSSMEVPGRSWQRVLDLVLKAGGDRYITGHGAAAYMDHEAFEAAGVSIEYMDYGLEIWPRGGAKATPYQSVLDLIGWTGPDARDVLKPATVPWREFLAKRAQSDASLDDNL